MPQLNPSPWFAILIFSWLVFFTILPLKVKSTILPNGVNPLTFKSHFAPSWIWPWL